MATITVTEIVNSITVSEDETIITVTPTEQVVSVTAEAVVINATTDHTEFTNIGNNTHAEIDNHIADGTLHFTQAAISITESQISDLGTYEPADATILKGADIDVTVQGYDATNINESSSIKDLSDVLTSMTPTDGQVLTFDTTNGWQAETNSSSDTTDHLLFTNIGTNSHAQLDSHLADGTLHYTQAAISITESQISDFGTYETADATILKDADIGVTVEAYDAGIQTHLANTTKHRLINDAGTLTTELFSASKIISDLSGKSDTGHSHVKADITDFTESDYATGAEGDLATSALQDITGEAIGSLSDVVITTVADTDVLQYNGVNWVNVDVSTVGQTDHTQLTNIGTNTHAEIDTHIADGTLHFTQAAISITESQISDLGTYQPTSAKNQVSGYAGLDAAGLLDPTQLPPLAITSTYVVANETAQLALTVQEGDVAVRSDENKSYIALNDTNATMGDWQLLLTPTDVVLSVAGKTGVVTLVEADISDFGSYEPADATILKDADIGVNVQAYDATIVVDADIGVTVQGYNANTALTSDITYEQLNTNGDVGTTAGTLAIGDHTHTGVYEPADATILKDSDIGVNVQAYDATILVDADIGVTVMAYDATPVDSVAGRTGDVVIDSDDIALANVIGSPAHVTNASEVLNHVYSAGVVDGGAITDNANGTIDIAAGECFIRATDDHHTTLSISTFTGATALALTDNTVNYVYVDYNAGAPNLAVTLDPTIINMTTKVAHAVVTREGTHLTIINVGDDSVDMNAKMRRKMFYTQPFTRSNGGAIVSTPSGLDIACTVGEFWFGLTPLPLPALDTTGADTFEYYYTSDSGTSWTRSDASALNDTQYNDITSGLVAVASNKFVNHWIYALMSTEGTSHHAVVYGQAEYNSLAEAQNESPPATLPPSVATIGILLGVFTTKDTNGTVQASASAFEQTFTSSQVTSHTDLTNIGTNSHAQIDSHIADSTLHFTQAAISITESQISDLGSYLTAETNDLSSVVTWANVPDANITETSVTQHEAALSITESQISDLAHFGGTVNDLTDVTNTTPADKHVLVFDGVTDNKYENRLLVEADISDLGSYLTAEVNDLSSAVTWVNVPSANITEASVTQHEAAISITESQISDFGTYLTDITGEILTDLSDIPTITGNAGKLLKVNATEDGYLWGDPAGTTVSWGDIAGTLSNQTDLQSALDGKEAADATILKDADIGVTVQAYDATYVVDADIGVTVAAESHTHVEADITDLDKYTQAEVDALLDDGTF